MVIRFFLEEIMVLMVGGFCLIFKYLMFLKYLSRCGYKLKLIKYIKIFI